MGFQKIDKKQMPQVIGLGVASCGMFGFFAFKMMAPTASAAPPPPPAKKADAAVASATPSASLAAGAAPSLAPDAPPPTPGMRDPFVPAISDKAPAVVPVKPVKPAGPQVASRLTSDSASLHVPSAPPLPSLGSGGDRSLTPLPGSGSPASVSPNRVAPGLTPMPVALAAPAWTVTGVLKGETGDMVVLRNGDERRILQAGDMVDSQFRVAAVTRQYVVLRHGAQSFTLPLGGRKAAPAAKPQTVPQNAAFKAAPDLAPTAISAPSLKAQGPDPAQPGRQVTQEVVQTLGATAGEPTETATAISELQNVTQTR